MRISNSMYYENLYGKNNDSLNKNLFDVNKQIASGLKIHYAQEDIRAFTETMRLDNEVATLSQSKQSAESGYKVSKQTDIILNEFQTSMDRMKTLLIQSANAGHSAASMDAIALELRGLEGHLKNLANTSINGQYLFSGSAIDTKPISSDGTYMGNNVALESFLGSNIKQQYNLTGAELFLGDELVRREVSTNVRLYSITAQYPDFTDLSVQGKEEFISSDSTIRDLMGDLDNNIDTVNAKHHFYIRGASSDGTSFNQKISMRDDEKVDELLNKIGNAYGNTPNLKVVNVTLNHDGEIVVEDKIKGSSKLDFHIVGATDFVNGGTALDAADVTDIGLLDGGQTDFNEIINPTIPPANTLYVREFVRSDFTAANGAPANIDALLYDRTQFSKNGSKLLSNIPQILKDTNANANPLTKISEVADLSKGTAGTLDGTQLTLSGTDVAGTPFNVQIDFLSAGSTFSLDGGVTNYEIFDMQTPRAAVDADEMTYQQLMDVINMVVTNNIPASTNVATDYDDAISDSESSGKTYLSYDGKIVFEDLHATDTKASIAIHDSNSGDFTADAPVMTFNSNNALTIRDPKTDFFKSIDEIIKSVEEHKIYPDASSGSSRSVGVQNAIKMIDDLSEHVSQSHSKVGAQSNALNVSVQRIELLQLNTMSLRSAVIDTDLAEASLKLSQLSLNYEAMLSTVGKISKLSLVNYI